jgi:hypothetical protein
MAALHGLEGSNPQVHQLGSMAFQTGVGEQQRQLFGGSLQAGMHRALPHVPAHLYGPASVGIAQETPDNSLLQGSVVNQLLHNYLQLCGISQACPDCYLPALPYSMLCAWRVLCYTFLVLTAASYG